MLSRSSSIAKKLIRSREFAASATEISRLKYKEEIHNLRKTWHSEYKEKEKQKKLERIEDRKEQIQRQAVNLRVRNAQAAINKEAHLKRIEAANQAFREKLALSKILKNREMLDLQKKYETMVGEENMDQLIVPELFAQPGSTGLFTGSSEHWRWAAVPDDPLLSLNYEENESEHLVPLSRYPNSHPNPLSPSEQGFEAAMRKKDQRKSQMFLDQLEQMNDMVSSGEERDTFSQHLSDFRAVMEEQDWSADSDILDEDGKLEPMAWHSIEDRIRIDAHNRKPKSQDSEQEAWLGGETATEWDKEEEEPEEKEVEDEKVEQERLNGERAKFYLASMGLSPLGTPLNGDLAAFKATFLAPLEAQLAECEGDEEAKAEIRAEMQEVLSMVEGWQKALEAGDPLAMTSDEREEMEREEEEQAKKQQLEAQREDSKAVEGQGAQTQAPVQDTQIQSVMIGGVERQVGTLHGKKYTFKLRKGHWEDDDAEDEPEGGEGEEMEMGEDDDEDDDMSEEEYDDMMDRDNRAGRYSHSGDLPPPPLLQFARKKVFSKGGKGKKIDVKAAKAQAKTKGKKK